MALEKGVEGMEKFLLQSCLPVQKLDVIDHQHIDLAVFLAKSRHAVGLKRLYILVGERFAVDEADFVIANIGGVGGGGGGYYSSSVHVNDLHICAKYGVYQIIGERDN